MRRLFHSTICIAFFLYAFNASGQGFLKASGRIIVNEKGEKVILRGMGLGGWMLQEGYMLRVGNIGQQHLIKEKIAALVGQEKADQFYKDWLADHTRKADIDSLASWGFNAVRIPLHYRLFTLSVDEEPIAGKNTWLQQGFALTDSLLSWCKADHIYLILDMHATPGGQGNDLPISDRYPEKPSLWESEADRRKMISLWKKLAERYAGEPNIGGYDIINEPNWGFEDPNDKRGNAENGNKPLKQLMMDITAAIRSVDKRHLIIIEGNAFGNNYRGILPPWDNNMALSFHKYGNFNTEAAIHGFLDLRERYNIPLWMGESGENSNTWYTENIRLAESHDIGWSWWPLKKMGINNPLEIPVSPGYQQLLDYWNGKGPQPSAGETEGILQQLLKDIRIENNIYHRDVIDAMFRQVHDATAIPFHPRSLPGFGTTRILAVNYDLGRQGVAYFDRDTASYQYTPGVKTIGNKGHAYRNDGVDITGKKDDYYVFSIEDGEWLQYTGTILQAGKYTIGLEVSAESDTGRFSIQLNGQPLLPSTAVPNTGGPENWRTVEAKGVYLPAGMVSLKVYADKGGFNFMALKIGPAAQ